MYRIVYTKLSYSLLSQYGQCMVWIAACCICVRVWLRLGWYRRHLCKRHGKVREWGYNVHVYILDFFLRNVLLLRCLQMFLQIFLQWRCPDFTLRDREERRRNQCRDVCAGICSRGRARDECPLVPLGQSENMVANLGECMYALGWLKLAHEWHNRTGCHGCPYWIYTRATLICQSSLSR